VGWSAKRLREYAITAGTLGSTAGQTLMVAVLPVLLARYTKSAIWIGFAVGGEGIFALLVPYWIGLLSDRLPMPLARRFGRRSFFLMVTAPVMIVSLAVAPFLDGYWQLAGAAFVFFCALHGYLTPLWALMVDAVPDERRGRVQGIRGALHAAGLGFGLVASGILYSIWNPLPFILGAVLIAITTTITVIAAPPEARAAPTHHAPAEEEKPRAALRIWSELKRTPSIRWFLLANALWSGAVDGIRPYIFLFATIVVGITLAQTSMVLSVLVVGAGVGAVILGRLSDRTDRTRLLQIGGAITTGAMLFGFFVRDMSGVVVLLLAAGVGAAALIALPYPIFAALVGSEAIGRYTGLYILTVGLGRILAPMAVGAAIDVARPMLPVQRGYPMMWPVAGLMSLLGMVALHVAMRHARREKEVEA
jgi:maltose/moltooligosaccharide transporter